MARLTRPMFWLKQITRLVLLVPAAAGWWWAFIHFHLGEMVGFSIMFGLVMTAGYVALAMARPIEGQRVFWRRVSIMCVISMLGSPAFFTYLDLAANHPTAWKALCVFTIMRLGLVVFPALRRGVASLRADAA